MGLNTATKINMFFPWYSGIVSDEGDGCVPLLMKNGRLLGSGHSSRKQHRPIIHKADSEREALE